MIKKEELGNYKTIHFHFIFNSSGRLSSMYSRIEKKQTPKWGRSKYLITRDKVSKSFVRFPLHHLNSITRPSNHFKRWRKLLKRERDGTTTTKITNAYNIPDTNLYTRWGWLPRLGIWPVSTSSLRIRQSVLSYFPSRTDILYRDRNQEKVDSLKSSP